MFKAFENYNHRDEIIIKTDLEIFPLILPAVGMNNHVRLCR